MLAQAIDAVGDSLGIGKHVGCGNSKDLQPQRTHVSIAAVVGVLPRLMDCSIDFDDDFCRRAVEIGNEGTDRVLPAEAEFAPFDAQQSPQQHFREAELSA